MPKLMIFLDLFLCGLGAEVFRKERKARGDGRSLEKPNRQFFISARVSSTRRRNGLAQLSGWRLEAQGLTRSFVETSGDLVQECLRMAG